MYRRLILLSNGLINEKYTIKMTAGLLITKMGGPNERWPSIKVGQSFGGFCSLCLFPLLSLRRRCSPPLLLALCRRWLWPQQQITTPLPFSSSRIPNPSNWGSFTVRPRPPRDRCELKNWRAKASLSERLVCCQRFYLWWWF